MIGKMVDRNLTAALITLAALGFAGAVRGQEGSFESMGRIQDPGVNSSFIDHAPEVSADGTKLYFGSYAPSSGGNSDIVVSTRTWNDGGWWEPWTPAQPLPGNVNTGANEANPTLTSDGQMIYFSSDRCCGTYLLYEARWDPDLGFVDARRLEGLGSVYEASAPWISPNGLELYFASANRPCGRGGYNLWVAWRDSTEEPFDETRLKSLDTINSNYPDASPSLSSDGRTIFWCGFLPGDSQDGSTARRSLWMAKRSTADRLPGEPPPVDWTTIQRLPFSDTVLGAAISPSWPADGSEVFYTGFALAAMTSTGDIHVAVWHETPPPSGFLRGDCDGRGSIEGITDAVFLLGFLFLGGPEPPCLAACDPNGDGSSDLSDAVFILSFSFLGGPDPVAPFPDCGPGYLPGDTKLGCEIPSC